MVYFNAVRRTLVLSFCAAPARDLSVCCSWVGRAGAAAFARDWFCTAIQRTTHLSANRYL
jgi:hypothetical protein